MCLEYSGAAATPHCFPMVYVISVAPAASVWQHFGAKIASGRIWRVAGWFFHVIDTLYGADISTGRGTCLHAELGAQVNLANMLIRQYLLCGAGGDDMPLTDDIGLFADIQGIAHVVIGN